MKKLFFVAALMAVVMGVNAQEAKKDAIYGVKSGIITMEMDMMGQAIVQQIYFDDFGAKQATVSEFGGNKMRTIVLDGQNVMINEAEKTATRMPAMGFGGGRATINYNNLTEQVMKDNKIKELGQETIAGKACKKYSVTMDMMGQSMEQNVWVYKGVVLKTASESEFGAMGQTATKFEENVTVPASMFTVPEGITVQDMDMNMMMGGGF